MKHIITTLAALLLAISVHAQCDTLRLSSMYTTHLIFNTELSYVDVSNKALAAKLIESSKNILAIKARMPFEYTTTISALESNGQMHTYIVIYEAEPKELVLDMRRDKMLTSTKKAVQSRPQSGDSIQPSDLVGHKQQLYHIADKKYRIQALCESVLINGEQTFFIISLKNKSGINYECADAGFMIESKKKTRRGLDYQKVLSPKSRFGSLSAGSGERSTMVYTMDKVTLAKDQVLNIYLYEVGGSRNLMLTLTAQDMNEAASYRLL